MPVNGSASFKNIRRNSLISIVVYDFCRFPAFEKKINGALKQSEKVRVSALTGFSDRSNCPD
jgi:hypothetical protein